MKPDAFSNPVELDAELAAELRQLLAEQTGRPPATISDDEVREAHRRFLAAYEADLARRSLQTAFEDQVERQPGEVAVLFRGKPTSYAELDRLSNRLARFLRRKGVGPETLVGVSLPPSVDRVAALLAIVKAGGAYVPIAPGPRGAAVRAAARPALVLSAELPQAWEAMSQESDAPLEDAAAPENLAAVVDDGAGRLVPVERRHLLNRLEQLQAEVELGSADVLLCSGDEDADGEILWALLYGARLVIAPGEGPALIGEHGATILRLTPARLAALLADPAAPLATLRAVLCGGATLRAGLAARFAERSPARLIPFYAPAEAAAEVSFYTGAAPGGRDPLPVGDTFNLSVLLLDPYQQPVPRGMPGEIHLAGEELPRGFFGDPCATAEAFLPDPFAEAPGSRLLRTGDLGLLLPEGALTLTGAAGRRVWIGGRRLDLGAMEAELLADPSVQEAALLVREIAAGAPRLVAYLVVSGAWIPEWHAERLRSRWPEELLPAAWVPLSRLPLTSAGRLDETALLRLPVIDDELVAGWEERLSSVPEVEEAAVCVGETSETLPLIHLDDLLPGWRSTAVRPSGAAAAARERVEPAAAASETPSLNRGMALALPADAPATLADALERAARLHPDHGVTYLGPDGAETFQTYPELLESSQRLLAGLRRLALAPGDKVLFQLDRLEDFVTAFWAAMLGGFVPVPLSIAPTYEQPNAAVHKLANAWRMLDRPLILTGRELLPAVQSLADLLGLEGWRVEAVDALRRHAPDRERHAGREDDLALLLLTSGSTGLPKAVMQTHRALLMRCAATASHNVFTPADVSLNWMPLDHVGGVVMFHLRDVCIGSRQVHAPTAAVLADPLLWLDWIERFQATITWAPNFAFALVNDRAAEIARRRWDLSSMRFILNAGEAIVARTARTFLRLLQPYGLPDTAMKPAWGMSETCSAITFSHDFTLASTRDEDPFVEVGQAIPEAAVRIADGEGQVVPEGTIGRLQVQGTMITAGYDRNPQANADSFTADGWFDTGDLGVLRNGRLSITGRAKDVIIINGINYYSHEIEAVVEEIEGVEVSFTAACPVREMGGDTDELAIFFHTPEEDWSRRIELIEKIRDHVTEKSGLNPAYVIPMAQEEIPKTAIGKIQRSQLRQRLEAGELSDVLREIDLRTGHPGRTLPAWFYHRVWRPREPAPRPAAPPAGRALVFLDPHGLGADLCRRLERRGQHCVTVEPGPDYARIDARRFVLNPAESDHYRRLLAALGEPVGRVVHLWSCGQPEDEVASLEALRRAQERGVYSVLFLVQALVEAQGEQRPVELAVVSSHAQLTSPSDRLLSAGACLPGLLKTIAVELPSIRCRQIDLDLGLEHGRAEADGRRLVRELDLPAGEAEVAWRGDQRLVPALVPADLPGEERGEMPIVPGGLYLVTGGLGGIGGRLAHLLHESFGARLLLTGRTALPEPAEWPRHLEDPQTPLARRLSAHLALEWAGAEFVYRAVDVLDREGLERAVAEAEARWQRPLDGIFHLASVSSLEEHWTVADRHRVATETRESFETMFDPKVYGTWVLCQLLHDRPQALFVAFSSVNSLFGGSTFSAYSAANSFLDACTLHQRYQHGRRACCFNWSLWDDLGMSRGNPEFARDAAHAAGYFSLSIERGLVSLLAGLERGAAQLVVGLDGGNRHLRHRVFAAACDREELNAFFTGAAEAGDLHELSVADRFGTPSACRLHRLADMPRTAEGEIDREALMALGERGQTAGPAERVAPRTETERLLAEVWEQVLRAGSPVGIHDNFFHLGGDSILSIQIVARAAERGLRLAPKQIFESPTIAELAAVVESSGPREAEQELVIGVVPLTPIQRWFFEQELPDPHHFNMALLFEVRRPLDGGLLALAVAHLVLHHDALRMRYRRRGDGWQQVNAGAEELPCYSSVDLAAEPAAERRKAVETTAGALQASLSLADGPLLRVACFGFGPGEPGRLLLVLHHLVVDGVSWRILLQDLITVYGQLAAGAEARLPPKTTSFKRWSERLNELVWSDALTAEAPYWLAEPRRRTSPLPVDFGDGENTAGSARTVSVHLDAEETRALLQEVPRAYRTQINDAMLTALVQVLTAWTGAGVVLIDLEGHGREELFADVDLSRTVGWFTTLYPVLLELDSGLPPGMALKSIKEQLRGVPQRGIGYGLLRSRGDETAAALQSLPPAEVSFNYLGQLDPGFAEPGEFAIAREPAGELCNPAGARPHRLDVFAQVVEGHLEIGWIYSRNVHADATVERLAQGFAAALRTLIAHCLSSEAGGATPSDFPLAGLDQAQVDRLIGGDRAAADVYPLSPMQQGMLFHTLDSPELGLYFDQMSCTLKGALDVAAFEAAWQTVIDRHAILRTGFVWQDLGRPLQIVRRHVALPLRREDWRGTPADGQRLAAFLEQDRKLGFDLGRAPVMRLTLIQLDGDRHQFVWSSHHILLDGWSRLLVLKEVFACYEARRQGRQPELARPFPYRDYVAWLERQSLEAAESYWRRTLARFTAATRLIDPGRCETAVPPAEDYASTELRLSPELTARLQTQAQRHQLTLNTLVQAAWGRLLSCYSGDSDVVFGATSAGRPADLPGVESMVGLFISTLPVRMAVPGDEPLLSWLQRLQEQQVERSQYEFAPLTQVQRWSEVAPGQPLFEILYAFENFPVDASLREGIASLEVETVDLVERINYPLSLAALPGTELALQIYHDTSRFDPPVVRRLLGHVATFLAGVAESLDRRVGEVPLLSAAETRQLVAERTASAIRDDRSASIGLRGETRAAVVDLGSGQQLTGRELDERANRLARFLRRRGVGAETLVGLCLPPSVDRVVALLAVLRAGGAFLAIDPGPRGAAVRAAAHPAFVLSAAPLDGEGVIVLPQVGEAIDREDGGSLDETAAPENLAAVAVDGTGRGVLVERRHLLDRLERLQAAVGLGSADVLLCSGGEGSDGEILWALLYGGRLLIAAEARPADLDRHGATVLRVTPARLAVLLADRRAPLDALRAVLCGGEPLRAGLAARFAERSPARLIHLYAPPEAAAEVSLHTIAAHESRDPLPVGSTFNLSVLLLDPYLQPVPQGLPGEIHLAGEELPRGFLGDPRATAEAFLPDPFAEAPGSRLLRTGDLGLLLPDGVLALAGAAGRQAWIGGRRSDLGAIEAALLDDPSVEEAAVLVRETTAATQLVAYLVVSGPWVPERYAERLRSRWPEELLPAAWVPLSRLPLTAAGRLDEAALLRLPVIDDRLVAEWEESLSFVPDVEEVAVCVGETSETQPLIHLDDLLPGWRSSAAQRAGGGAGGAGRPEPAAAASGAASVRRGRALALPSDAPATLADALERAARRSPDHGITYVRPGGAEVFQTYPELLETSQRLLAGLRRLGLAPGDKVLFQLDRLEDFVAAFWASALGGFVPVPLSIAPTYEQPNTAVHKLANAWRMLDRPLILTGGELLPAVRSLADLLGLEEWRVEAVEALRRDEPDRERHAGREDDLALLLLTSGSTGLPKAVTQTHRALLTRSAATAGHNDFVPEDVSLNWMPLDHVGGLVMFHLRDVYVGCRQIQAPTAAVLADPLLWLDWIERHRATITWAPNFAFGLVNDRAAEIARRRWDLSSMRFILNGGEAIVARTARTFLRLLQPHGLADTAMKPAWGMSETCSGITFSHDFTLATTRDEDPFVEVGLPISEASVRIADAEGQVVSEGTVGRLQVEGPMITAGYYRNPEVNAESFTVDGWFDTGDLGVLRDGRLSITGRAKDVIIINGINYYSHEIEAVVEEIEGVEVSFTAACPAREAGSDTDQLAIFFHTPEEDWSRRIELIGKIRDCVTDKSGLNPAYVIPMAQEDIPKTAIGKIQRAQLRQRLEAGELSEVLRQIDLRTGHPARTLPAWFFHRVWRPRERALRPAARPAGRWVVFLDPHGLGADLCRRLEHRGQHCVTVEPGKDYARIDDRRFVLNPGAGDHYRRLLAALGEPVERLVHLWSCGQPEDEVASLEALRRAQERGVYSVLFLVQALVEAHGEQHPVELSVVSSHAQLTSPGDRLLSAGACLPGLLKTIAVELPSIRCRQIDLDLGLEEAEVDSRRLLRELDLPGGEAEVAFRGDQRLVPALARADLLAEERGEMPIVPGGLYLVTGGLGGIGGRLAHLLHESFGARLLLTGRTALPDPAEWPRHLEKPQTPLARRLGAHLSLERAGADFAYRAVDVLDREGLERAVAEAEARWQRPLDGIFHLAGVSSEANLEEHWAISDWHRVATEARETFEKMFGAKVYGTWVLCQLLHDRPHALFVAFSSVNSLFGGSTFSAYSAANSFLDACTLQQSYQNGRRAYCFNWAMWDDLGMSRGNPAFARDAAHAAGYQTLSPERGLYSLLAGLERGAAQLVVGLDGDNRHLRHRVLAAACDRQELNAFFTGPAEAGDLQEVSVKDRFGTLSACRLHRLAALPRTAAGEIDREALMTLGEREQTAGPAERVAPRTEIERQLAETWEQVLETGSPVGIHDNFFQLGGDSILSIHVVARAVERGLHLTSLEIFQRPTIAELAAEIEARALRSPVAAETAAEIDFSTAQLDGFKARLLDAGIAADPVESAYPLSPLQHGMLFQSLDSYAAAMYFVQFHVTFSGAFDPETFARAWQRVVDLNPELRISFVWRGLSEPLQVVHRHCELQLDRLAWLDASAGEQELRLANYLQANRELGCELSRPPLMRLSLIQLAADTWQFVWGFHHLLVDGWSAPLVLREVFEVYEALRRGQETPAATSRSSYRSYIAWLLRQDRSRAESFWRRQLDGFSTPTPLGIDRPPGAAPELTEQERRGKKRSQLDLATSKGLRELARQNQLTLNTLMQGTWALLLGSYSGTDDVMFGTTVSGRPPELKGVESMLGMLINTLPLRARIEPDKPLLTWLSELQAAQVEAREYDYTPLVDVHGWSAVPRGRQLFESLMVFENLPMDASLGRLLTDVEVASADFFSSERSSHPITWIIGPVEEIFIVAFYDRARIADEAIAQVLEHWQALLREVVAHPEVRTGEIGAIEATGWWGEAPARARTQDHVEEFDL